MSSINSLRDWASSNETLLWWLFAGSIAAFAITPIAVAATLIRLPPDYFAKPHRRPLESLMDRPALRLILLEVKNLLGVVLLIAGLAMLLLPGQGMLTILVGLILTDFPGKFRFQRWLVTRPSVWRSINWLRRHRNRPPLKRPS